jgi:hypothetical protein
LGPEADLRIQGIATLTSLLRGSEEEQSRRLLRVGFAVVLVVALAVAANFGLPFTRTPAGVISIAIQTPYVGQGVAAGTPLIIHGVKVGHVTQVSSSAGGDVRLNVDIDSGPTQGLTDTFGLDYRPSNYFGVTGVNIIPGQGGAPLRSGAKISVTPAGNFTLQALLYRLGQLSNQVVTPRLISVVERATRYTDALTPLLETMVVVSTTVADVQSVSTEQLVRNTAGINVAFPGFVDALINTGDLFLKSDIGTGFNAEKDLQDNKYAPMYDDLLRSQYDKNRNLLATNPDAYARGPFQEWLRGAEDDLFTPVGHLLSSHISDLLPAVNELKAITDVVPHLAPSTDIANTLRELRERLERMYAGSGDQRALQVRVIVDSLPAVAGPIGLALGAPE